MQKIRPQDFWTEGAEQIYFAENTKAICQKSKDPSDFITIYKFGCFKNLL